MQDYASNLLFLGGSLLPPEEEIENTNGSWNENDSTNACYGLVYRASSKQFDKMGYDYV